MSTIQSIKDIDGGWIITTLDQEVSMSISTGQACCENWGYITSEDNLEDFVGSELLSVSITDEQLATIDLAAVASIEVAAIFINVHTSAGLLQFVLYNDHNGYYSHSVSVTSRELNFHGYL